MAVGPIIQTDESAGFAVPTMAVVTASPATGVDNNSSPLPTTKNTNTADVQFPMADTLNWLASGDFENPYPASNDDVIFMGNGAPIAGPSNVIDASDIMAANEAIQESNINSQENLISTGAFDFITNSSEFAEETTMFTKFADQVRANIANMNVSSGGMCCFIFLAANDGFLDPVVRRYRDEHMTERNRRGYYRLADVLIPLMKKSETIKELVNVCMVRPMTQYGRWFYGVSEKGKCFEKLSHIWLSTFNLLGFGVYRRKNGELI